MTRVGEAVAVDRAPGYRPDRTLRLGVEAVRQLRRRRTAVMFGLLAALPWILVAAFGLGGDSDDPGGDFFDLATASGLNFAAFTLMVSSNFLLVVTVALFCGDTVASEAGWSTLKYLLAMPVPRARLLRHKLVVGLGYSAAGIVLLAAMALLAGTIAWG